MEIKTVNDGENRTLIYEWLVNHKETPNIKKRLRTLQKLSAAEVKEKLVRAGLFERDQISELRVRKKKP
jgi:predicted DNA-binding transcriptional regulator